MDCGGFQQLGNGIRLHDIEVHTMLFHQRDKREETSFEGT